MIHFGKVEFERRRFPRFRLELPITYYRMEQEMGFPAKTGNISKGGLLLYLNETVVPGDRLKVQMRLTDPKATELIKFIAKVMWVKLPSENGGAKYYVGILFEEISPRNLKTLQRFEHLWLEQPC